MLVNGGMKEEEEGEKKVPDELQGPGALREQTITALSRCTTLFSSIISAHLRSTRGSDQKTGLKTPASQSIWPDSNISDGC